MARSFAQEARGFSVVSSAVPITGFLVMTRAVGVLPQMQTGAFGGQVHGCSYLRNACLTIRSSNE